jgi:hypothetical protein
VPRSLRIPLLFSAFIGIAFLFTALFQNFTGSGSRDARASERNKPVITKPTEIQIAEFASKAQIAVPPSAQAVGWREERGGLDDALWLQFTMPKRDLDVFLSSSPFRGVQLRTKHESPPSHFDGFFTTPPPQYRSGQEWLPNARVLNILIDESDAASAQVYLMWHET